MSSRVQPEDYKDYTVAELKSILKERRQPVSGTKTELVERLYNSYTVAELKIILKEEGLPVSGKKAEMLERLQIPHLTKPVRYKTGAVGDSGFPYYYVKGVVPATITSSVAPIWPPPTAVATLSRTSSRHRPWAMAWR